MIVVIGATGQLGRGIIDGLLARMAANRVVANARDSAQTATLAARYVEVRHGDTPSQITRTSYQVATPSGARHAATRCGRSGPKSAIQQSFSSEQ